jgi:hypothetical protein
LQDFKSVSTAAARYQNLAINQSKLSGQCGRLKCCLNYELNAYVEAFKEFPKNCERIEVAEGTLELMKTDIFKRLMFYTLREVRFGKIYAINVDRVREIKEQNKKGVKPTEIGDVAVTVKVRTKEEQEDDKIGFVDVTGEIELKPMSKNKKTKKRPQDRTNRPANAQGGSDLPKANRPPNPNQNRENRPPQANRPPNQNDPEQPNRENRPPNPNQNRENRPPQANRPPNPNRNRPPQDNRPPKE